MKVVVVGAGIGGLALALALRRRGLDPVVVEQSGVLGEVGAGLQLSPNAMKALQYLGVADETALGAWTPDRAEVRDVAGRVLLTTPLGAAAAKRWGAPYLQLHRADLLETLRGAYSRAGGRPPLLGVAAKTIETDGVRLEDGTRLAADLIVGCDGVRSLVRGFVSGAAPARFTGQVAWRGLARADDLSNPPTGAEVVAGPLGHFVSYRIRGGDLVNFVAVAEERAWRVESWSEPGDPANLLERFAAWPRAVRDTIAAAPQVLRWALFDRPPLGRWSRGAVGLLGDAAHPMLPFFAQGAAMALEDAVILDRCLAVREGAAKALLRYGGLRAPRTARVQALSRFNARLFHAPVALSGAAFAAAAIMDRFRESGARFDWVYGYDPTHAPL